MAQRKKSSHNEVRPMKEDLREQLFNNGNHGLVTHIQVSTERITQLRGIMYDLDPELLMESSLIPVVPHDPTEFYAAVARPWMNRHSVLAKAEVRNSGSGLHAILWFDTPVEFATDGDRDRWDGVVKVVQAAVPADPDAPAITALTRPVGSVNSKNRRTVVQLKGGEPVTHDEVLQFSDQMAKAPFETVFTILTGGTEASPCPVCLREGSRLTAGRFVGRCYGHCGKVELAKLYDALLRSRDIPEKETEVHDNAK